jgi:hypothetical protein
VGLHRDRDLWLGGSRAAALWLGGSQAAAQGKVVGTLCSVGGTLRSVVGSPGAVVLVPGGNTRGQFLVAGREGSSLAVGM